MVASEERGGGDVKVPIVLDDSAGSAHQRSMNDAPEAPALVTDAEAEALTRDNPKGRLLEFCQRTKRGRPKLTLAKDGELHGVAMHLRVDGRVLGSGVHWSKKRMVAEQRAARALLDAMALSEEESEPGEELTTENEARVTRANAKGKLLERCVVLRLSPVFDVRPLVTGTSSRFEASAHVVLSDGREVWSPLRRGPTAKGTEHAVAELLLGELEAARAEASDEDDEDAIPEVGDDPRMILNELRQKGRLRDFGFALVRTEGPPHAPMFHMAGHIERNDGERLKAAPVAAPSKKMGERLIALRLVRMLAGTP